MTQLDHVKIKIIDQNIFLDYYSYAFIKIVHWTCLHADFYLHPMKTKCILFLGQQKPTNFLLKTSACKQIYVAYLWVRIALLYCKDILHVCQ